MEGHRGAGLLEQVLRSLSKAQNVISIFRTLIICILLSKQRKMSYFLSEFIGSRVMILTSHRVTRGPLDGRLEVHFSRPKV